MYKPHENRHRLTNLKMRLEEVNRAWTINDYESLLKFYVAIVPKIMDAQRCSIFIVEPGTERIWLKFGTGLKEKEFEPPRGGTVVGRAISTGQLVIENDLGRRHGFHTEVASKTGFITRNLVCAPIKSLTEQSVTGAIQVLNKHGEKIFTTEDGILLQEVTNYLAMAIENIMLNQEILQISNELNHEIEQLRKEHTGDVRFIAESRVMRSVLESVRIVSMTPVNVLLQGESGTGKELVARMIHDGGDRRDRPFVAVNCASIPENLMESEFFGYEKGAFTGAVSSRKGRFEEADGGILFLDEIADMPLVIQPKFLRAIQEGEGSRLGSNKLIRYNLRIISASNKDIRKEVKDGRFREDLFYRLFSVEIHIPPLRERQEDIVPLAMLFLKNVSQRFKKKVAGFSPEVLNFFEDYPWPGNVRQLRHEVERLIALTPEGERITLANFSQELQDWRNPRGITEPEDLTAHSLSEKVKVMEIRYINKALEETHGNKRRASMLLGITRQGLDKKIKRYNIAEK